MSMGPVARISTFAKTPIRILTTILLFGLFPGVSADCYIDLFGNEYCDPSILSTGAIAGIAVGGIFAVILISFGIWASLRRRTVTQTHVVYPPTNQTPYFPPAQPATGMAYGSPYGGSQPLYAPQYPLPVQKGASPYVYDPSPGYVQGAVSPPQHYAYPAPP